MTFPSPSLNIAWSSVNSMLIISNDNGPKGTSVAVQMVSLNSSLNGSMVQEPNMHAVAKKGMAPAKWLLVILLMVVQSVCDRLHTKDYA